MKNIQHRYAVVLCGGFGSRLWPLSRTLKPKQLLALNGNETLLQQTANRISKMITSDHLYTVTHEDLKFEVKGQPLEKHPCGDYVGEDDIVRFDDHYGRT